MRIIKLFQTFWITLLIGLYLAGCGGGGGEDLPALEVNTEVETEPLDLTVPDNTGSESYRILSMGNSHVGPIGGIIEILIGQSQTPKPVTAQLAPGGRFLDERIGDGVTLATLQSQQWTQVILQAQKYSISAGAIYPTTAAESWIRLSKAQGATPILFPEHPQLGNNQEGRMLYELHQSIAAKESACVAPIGLAWDEAITREPSLLLHNADGNHASATGALLTALVFYQVITGEPAVALPYIEQFDTDQPTQELLRQVASDTLALYPACI